MAKNMGIAKIKQIGENVLYFLSKLEQKTPVFCVILFVLCMVQFFSELIKSKLYLKDLT
jgi:hypothetical protein